jgi:hypothetical protein
MSFCFKKLFSCFFGECEGKVFEASNETNHWKIQPISFIPQIVSFNGRKTGERKTERRRIIPTKEKKYEIESELQRHRKRETVEDKRN